MKKYFYIILAIVVITACSSDDEEVPTGNFAGTFDQEDQMGRPGINTVFTPSNADENAFNVTPPSLQINLFQSTFQSRVETYYSEYSATAGTTLVYEDNVLGLDLPTLTTALSLDVLQVAPQGETTYFDRSSINTTPFFFTGRNPTDDVIDASLVLLFGGNNGGRFSSMPNLVSDNVGPGGSTTTTFPYLGTARF